MFGFNRIPINNKTEADLFIASGKYPNEIGDTIQNKTGLVINVERWNDPKNIKGKLKTKLNRNPIHKIFSYNYLEKNPEYILKHYCEIKSMKYKAFNPICFLMMMRELDEKYISGYLLACLDYKPCSMIPLLIGNENALSLSFLWDHENTEHKKMNLAIKTQHALIQQLHLMKIKNLYVGGGKMEFKTIFKPEVKTYG